jgi:hypothetical protein
MREVITAIFESWLVKNGHQPTSIAVVGGTNSEPELRLLQTLTPTFFGVESCRQSEFHYLDLNKPHDSVENKECFDLVLCSQVLEHIYDLPNAVRMVCGLVAKGGYVWMAFPASNFAHGSPEYFSAGYPAQTIVNLIPRGFTVIDSGQVGTKRHYRWIHYLHEWPSLRELEHPFRSIWTLKIGLYRKILRTVRRMRCLPLLLSDNNLRHDLTWATESWVLAVRTDTLPVDPRLT